ncbi:MAG TPA: FAD-dependent oxidoreductase [Jiangellaceae bacterium]|nr:FAD-dependent oxidoreductase [Jiangellaceae bacterium]
MTTAVPGGSDRPLLVSVDDDPAVLDAVVADLRARYGEMYRVVGAASGPDALEVIERATLRGSAVAAVVADQRMPGQTGTELLVEAKRVQPRLRSVLLTAYADTDAAIAAINDVSLDHYVLKPWDPPEERLYPVLDELLEEWQATRPREDVGLRVIGERWSAGCHRLREYLARNLVPFRWLDADHPEAAALLTAAGDDVTLPVLILEDGQVLADPTPAEVADMLHLSGAVEVDYYDVVVVGAGPSGLAAAVYAGSEGLRTLVVEAEAPGGQAGLSSRIENYLGFPGGVSGSELARRALAQARRFGSIVVSPRRAVRLRDAHPQHVVELDDGSELHCGAVVLATGVQYQRLDAVGADRLTGSGVYYGASSFEPDAWKGERVVVVGGANSAGQAALHLSQTAEQVVVVVRAATLAVRMSQYLITRIEQAPNIDVRTGTVLTGVSGAERLTAVRLRGPDGSEEELGAAGVFVFIGARPRTDWLDGQVVRDDHGFIVTGPALQPARWSLDRDPFLLETSRPGVFAVGDVRSTSMKRVASAVGEGSAAVQYVHAVLSGR